MSLLQLIITITGFVFLLFAVDLYQRQKFNLLHFLVFFGGTAVIVVFVLNPDRLDSFGKFFGIARGADLIVYMSIVWLAYFYFELLHSLTKQSAQMTRLVWRMAWDSDEVVPLADQHTSSPKSHYGFLIRAYNEGTVIEPVLQEIVDAGYHTIVICDDGSSDDTAAVLEQLKIANPTSQIVVLTHPINRGPWAANKTLFEYISKYGVQYFPQVQWRVTYDADGQMCIDDMETFGQYADHSLYDIVIGSRFVEWWKTENMPLTRRVILRWGRIVTYVFNGSWLRDVTTGYRMYHRDVLPKIHITSDRYSYQHQIIDALKIHSLKFIEIPVTIKYTDYSLHKGQGSGSAWKILKELIYKTFFYR